MPCFLIHPFAPLRKCAAAARRSCSIPLEPWSSDNPARRKGLIYDGARAYNDDCKP